MKRYIGYAIQSVVDKIGRNIELIIVDNNSSDTLKIVSLFEYLEPKIYNIDGPSYTLV